MSEQREVFVLTSADIGSNWNWIETFLLLVDDPPWSVDDVKVALQRQEAQLWCVGDVYDPQGIVITRLGKCGDTVTGLVWIAAGRGLDQGVNVYYEYIEPWFISKGCSMVEIIGRKGWKKVFRDFDERAVVLAKRVNYEQVGRDANNYYH